MMSQKLLLKATAALILVGISGGLLQAKEQPKNKQAIYRLVGYTAQTSFNALKGSARLTTGVLKNPLVAFTLGTFVAAPILRQTLFSIDPKGIKDIPGSFVKHTEHDINQAFINLYPWTQSMKTWAQEKKTKAEQVKIETTKKTQQLKTTTAETYNNLKQNETLNKYSNTASKFAQNSKEWASAKKDAFVKWVNEWRK